MPQSVTIRRRRLDQVAARHDGLPDDIIETQVEMAEEALDLLGDEDEMIVAAVDALDHNLTTVADALATGASPVPATRPTA